MESTRQGEHRKRGSKWKGRQDLNGRRGFVREAFKCSFLEIKLAVIMEEGR